jgi:ribosomal protein S15P/S13E
MIIFFAHSSSGNFRNNVEFRMELLLETFAHSALFSFAYVGKKSETTFTAFLERATKNMRIHVVDASKDRGQYGLLKQVEHSSALFSYAYKNVVEPYLTALSNGAANTPDIIIDSGAFTAFTTGKQVNIKDYVDWALRLKGQWESQLNSLHFMNLDVIGDQNESWVNHAKIEALGLKVMPIVTFNADRTHLERALDNYDYLALGGLVPYARQKVKLQQWLDYCFAIVMERYRKNGVMPKIHLLGITSKWVLMRYPCYSVDSSAWISSLRFGGGEVAGLKKVPRYTHSEASYEANIHVLREAIKDVQQTERTATELWRSRHIQW